VSNPIEEAQNALRQLVFSMLIEDAVSSRTITRANLVQQLRVETGGPGVNVNVPFNDDQLHAASWNQVVANLGICIQVLDHALSSAFGAKKDPGNSALALDEFDHARIIVYMLRSAFAHDPVNPRWECRGPYVAMFTVSTANVTLDTTALNGIPVKFDEIGGLEGYLKLFFFCLDRLKSQQQR
jgi:hypothetical protein